MSVVAKSFWLSKSARNMLTNLKPTRNPGRIEKMACATTPYLIELWRYL